MGGLGWFGLGWVGLVWSGLGWVGLGCLVGLGLGREQVIAGQGTIGMEILKARNGRKLDIVFACCGGGGLVAGIAAYIKQVRPEVKVTKKKKR